MTGIAQGFLNFVILMNDFLSKKAIITSSCLEKHMVC